MNAVPWHRVIKLTLAVAAFVFIALVPGLDDTTRTIGMLAAFGALVLA